MLLRRQYTYRRARIVTYPTNASYLELLMVAVTGKIQFWLNFLMAYRGDSGGDGGGGGG